MSRTVFLSFCVFALIIFTSNCKAGYALEILNDSLIANDSIQKELSDGDVANMINSLLMPGPQIVSNNETEQDLNESTDSDYNLDEMNNVSLDMQPNNSAEEDWNIETNDKKEDSLGDVFLDNKATDVKMENKTVLDMSNETDNMVKNVDSYQSPEKWWLVTEDSIEVDSRASKEKLPDDVKSVDNSEMLPLHLNNDSVTLESDSVRVDSFEDHDRMKDEPENLDYYEYTDENTLYEDKKQTSGEVEDVEYNEYIYDNYDSKKINSENEPSSTDSLQKETTLDNMGKDDAYEYVDLEKTDKELDWGDIEYNMNDNLDDEDVDFHLNDESAKDDADITEETESHKLTDVSSSTIQETMDNGKLIVANETFRTVYATTMFLSVCMIAVVFFLVWNRQRVRKYIMQFREGHPYTLTPSKRGDDEKNLLSNEIA